MAGGGVDGRVGRSATGLAAEGHDAVVLLGAAEAVAVADVGRVHTAAAVVGDGERRGHLDLNAQVAAVGAHAYAGYVDDVHHRAGLHGWYL